MKSHRSGHCPQYLASSAGKTTGQNWAFVAGLVIYFLLALIPVIGFVLFGLGTELFARKEIYRVAKSQQII